MAQRAAERAAQMPAGAQQRADMLGASLQSKQNQIAKRTHFDKAATNDNMIPVYPSGYKTEEDDSVLSHELYYNSSAMRTLTPFSSADPQDAYWALRSKYITDNGSVPNIGQAIAPEQAIDYKIRKYDQMLEDQFKSFIFQQIKLDEPAQRQYWEEHFPEYTQEIQNAWELELEYQKRLGLIQIKGVQSMEDMWFLFCREKGLDNFASKYTGVAPSATAIPDKFALPVQYPGPATAGDGIPLNHGMARTPEVQATEQNRQYFYNRLNL